MRVSQEGENACIVLIIEKQEDGLYRLWDILAENDDVTMATAITERLRLQREGASYDDRKKKQSLAAFVACEMNIHLATLAEEGKKVVLVHRD